MKRAGKMLVRQVVEVGGALRYMYDEMYYVWTHVNKLLLLLL